MPTINTLGRRAQHRRAASPLSVEARGGTCLCLGSKSIPLETEWIPGGGRGSARARAAAAPRPIVSPSFNPRFHDANYHWNWKKESRRLQSGYILRLVSG